MYRLWELYVYSFIYTVYGIQRINCYQDMCLLQKDVLFVKKETYVVYPGVPINTYTYHNTCFFFNTYDKYMCLLVLRDKQHVFLF